MAARLDSFQCRATVRVLVSGQVQVEWPPASHRVKHLRGRLRFGGGVLVSSSRSVNGDTLDGVTDTAPEQADAADLTNMLSALDEPFVFTQRQALTVDGLITELRKRKVGWADRGQIEALHREGLFVPIYSIAYDPANVRTRAAAVGRQMSKDDVRAILEYTTTEGFGLIEERAVGDLRSPSADGYTPWRRERRTFQGRPYQTKQYLYSYHQLLAVPMIERLWPRLEGRRGGTWKLKLHPYELAFARPEASFFARLVRPLTVLEAVYLPEIVENLSMPGLRSGDWEQDFRDWDDFRASFDPVAALAGLGMTAEAVLSTGEGLLTRAKGLDPAAAWHELTRMVHPSFWTRLEGDARTAMDYRIAGELFLLFYEDLARHNAAPELEPITGRSWHPRLERLQTDRSELDQTLTRFGLSPHRAVVVILEGKTEQLIVPRVFDRIYKPSWKNRIRLFDAQGVNQNIDTLAAFVATPPVIDSEGDAVTLAYQPTRFVVLSDAEGPNASAHSRAQRHTKWINRIFDALPYQLREEIDRSELDDLVQIKVWDETGLDFERAHFTDEELADGLLAIAPHGPSRTELLERLARSRAERSGLGRVWTDWPRPPQPQKPRLAEYLWPVLEGKIDAAREAKSPEDVPVLKAVVEVMDLARRYPRHTRVVMRRKKPPDESTG